MQTAAYEALLSYYGSGSADTENEYVLKTLKADENNGITTDVTKGTLTYNGQTWTISEILGKSKEQTKLANNGLTEITETTSETIQSLLDNENVRMVVIEEADKDNENATYAVIPKGFYYVTGTPAEGLVVSDVNGDDDSNSKGGNQFVWVPCNGDDGVTYEYTNGLATTWTTNYKRYQYFYTTVPDTTTSISDCWSDNGGNATSVATYGGFYIGRYEAGVPEEASFYADSDGDTYYTNNEKNATAVTSYAPISKKGTQAWNFISQVNAITVSANMYTDTETYAVSSNLVDSYAWDTIVEWMVSSEGITRAKDESENAASKYTMDSTSYGNYYNNSSITATDSLYAYHVYRGIASTSSVTTGANWCYASKYKKGTVTTGGKTLTTADEITGYGISSDAYDDYGFADYTYSLRVELATGASDSTKINNIYDMAGNMWEWTTETGTHVTSASTQTTATYAVLRGGCFSGNGSSCPVSSRYGNSDIASSDADLGSVSCFI